MTKEEFIKNLKQNNSAPFLFVGSGFSRHYLDFPAWEGLLSKFAPIHINSYYAKCQTRSLPRIASEIAKDLNSQFWALEDNDSFKMKHQDDIGKFDSVFKLKISEFLLEKCQEDFPSEWDNELSLLQGLVIDGIITTNWDDTVERIFPNYKPFIGQQQLISASTFNIGEIYKIHGCMTIPDSLILTQEDYDNFNERNPYLAAKLITIFIEHPVVFFGYSINDPNIQQLLSSVVKGLDEEGITKLQSNLIFVEWTPYDTELRFEHVDILMECGARLPIIKVVTNDFSEVYSCLSYYERRLSANVLREYKKQFYNLIVSQKADTNLLVLPENKIDGNSEIQVVYGFGAVKKFRDAVGYVGIKSLDLYKDCINDDGDFDAFKILQVSIPQLRKSNSPNIPIYKYLRAVGINCDEEFKNNSLGINIELPRKESFASYKSFSSQEKQMTVTEVISHFTGLTTWKAIALIPYIEVTNDEIEILRQFISEHLTEYLIHSNNYKTLMRKLICFYDCLRYGWH